VEYNYAVPQLQERRARLAKAKQQLDARYLSLAEREQIWDLSATGASTRSIAQLLHRSGSTISREMLDRRHLGAVRRPPYRGQAPPGKKLRSWFSIRASANMFRKSCASTWTSEQICHALTGKHPDDQEMRVSPETIYLALHVQARGSLKKEVQPALRTCQTRRRPQNTGQERRSRITDRMIMIADRPPEIEDRAVPGHWEGDLITGMLNQPAIGTLVERTTRCVILVHLPQSHTAKAIRDGLVGAIATLPEHLRGS
jgi:IS30 family transposase